MKIELFGSKGSQTPAKLILNASKSLSKKKQLRHELWLLSCYVNFNIIKKLINNLRKEIKLTDVYLIFNFGEIFNAGPKKTKKILNGIEIWCQKKDINFEWVAVSHSSLIHAKGYALIQKNSGKISDGTVIVTSGNLTKNGFHGKNIEIGFSSNKINQLKQFVSTYDYIWENYEKDIDDKILNEEKHILKYSLLSSGVFLHKWSDTLKQELGIKYKLTKYAKNQVNMPEDLAAFGVDTGDSCTLQIIKTLKLPEKNIPKQFTRLYTVDTYWGRWCTKEVWNEVKKYLDDGSNFISSFNKLTTADKLASYQLEAIELQNKMYELNYIKKNDQSHITKWAERIKQLKNNEKKLERIYTGYDEHDLPYGYENTKEIKDLYDNLLESINLSKKPNIIAKKILQADESFDYGQLALSVSEKETLNGIFNKN